jgi:hypothetical protein
MPTPTGKTPTADQISPDMRRYLADKVQEDIDRLTAYKRQLLAGTNGVATKAGQAPKRVLSPEARKAMSDAAKNRHQQRAANREAAAAKPAEQPATPATPPAPKAEKPTAAKPATK